MRVALLLLIGALLAPAAKAAGYVPCTHYFQGDPAAPPEVAEILGVSEGTAVAVCGPADQPDLASYHFTSAVSRGPLGVCYYTERQIFRRANEQDKTDWVWLPEDLLQVPELRSYMAFGDNGCPAQGYDRYVWVTDVSEGVFIKLSGFWEDAVSSSEAFETFLASLPPEMAATPDFSDFADKTRSAIRSGSPPPLIGVHLDPSRFHIPHYELSTGSWEFSYILVVDFVDDSIEVLGLGWGVP